MHYTVDERRIAYQTVDGEVIAIDHVSGAYFSMQASAGEIWQMLAANAALDAIIVLYQENSPVPAETLATEIQAFVSELLAANLLQPNGASVTTQTNLSAIVKQRQPYTKPQLEKFEDMADLILIDPVHDVSDAGWPHVPKH
jgi:hypothetical protein